MIIIMNSIKIYKTLILILIIIILLIGSFVLFKKDLIQQMKVIAFWYLLILELNLINIYSVLSFYEKNRNRKGPKGYKGINGPRGLKGQSIMCSSCGLSGNNNAKYGRAFGIVNDKIKPGQCIFPFMQGYIYQNSPEKTVDPPFGIPKPRDNVYKGWCATTVDNQFNPTTIAFYDPSLTNQLEAEADLAKLKSQYIQSNFGIKDIKLVYGNTTREAKQIYSRNFERQGYEFIEEDLNQDTGGKFIYMCVLRGTGSKGIVDIKIRYFKDQEEANLFDENSFVSKGYRPIIDSNNIPVNLNFDSGPFTKTEDIPHIFMYVKRGATNFLKDVKVIKEGNTLPPNFIPINYEPDNEPSTDENDFREIGNKVVDLNRGTHDDRDFEKLFLLVKKNQNIISIDTAFVYNDDALYLFVSNMFYKLNIVKPNVSISVSEGYPKPLQEKWGRLPNLKKVNSEAVEIKDCSIYNGKEVKCSNTSNCFYDTILNKCEPLSVYDAVFVDQSGETFFFKGQFVYKYDSKAMKMMPGYPKLIDSEFPGLPSNIDAAFVWAKDNNTYIFKGNMHYKLHQITKKVDRGYPKKNNIRWANFPDMINAIFSYPKFITRNKSKIGTIPKGRNHTYIISQDSVFYLDPTTDIVERAGHINDILVGVEGIASDPVSITLPTRTQM